MRAEKLENSWRARWSEKSTRDGVTPLPNLFLSRYFDLGINTNEAMFIVHCFRYKWTVDSPYPSLETIAKQMGKDRNTVQAYARSLEEKGFLVRKEVSGRPSRLDFKNLIKILDLIQPYPNLNREGIQIATKPYLKIDSKEEPRIKGI